MRLPIDRIVSTSVDYLTATCNTKDGRDSLQEKATRWLRGEELAGNYMRRFTIVRYQGFACGSVSVAIDGPSLMVRLTGETANDYFVDVAEVATNISRLDFQTTVSLSQPCPKFAEIVERQALIYARERDSRLQVELKRNSKKGKTVYIGSRKSTRYMRVYDKGAQSKSPDWSNCWRGEVEMHDGLAMSRARQCLVVQDKNAFISVAVAQDLARAGIFWPMLPAAYANIPPLMPQATKTPVGQTDVQRTLAWLELQVAPSIKRLQGRVDADTIKRVLGISEFEGES